MEVGEERMTLPSPPFPDFLFAVTLLGHLSLGSIIGLAHFSAVRRSAHALIEARGQLAVVLFAGRIVLTGGVLAMSSLEGAFPLLATAAGLALGRFAVIRAGTGARA